MWYEDENGNVPELKEPLLLNLVREKLSKNNAYVCVVRSWISEQGEHLIPDSTMQVGAIVAQEELSKIICFDVGEQQKDILERSDIIGAEQLNLLLQFANENSFEKLEHQNTPISFAHFDTWIGIKQYSQLPYWIGIAGGFAINKEVDNFLDKIFELIPNMLEDEVT